jgi:type IV pilus assembly protein PilV
VNKNLKNNNCINRFVSYKKQTGFSLIEIMVAALVLSVGILGVAGLQMTAMKGTQHSYMKQQAMGVIHSLTERMHSNKTGVISGDYLLDSETFNCTQTAPVCSGLTSNCTPAQIALLDQHNLVCGYKAGVGRSTGGVKISSKNDIATFLGGELTVTCPTTCATGNVRIEANWDERQYTSNDEPIRGSIVINTRIMP